MAIHGDFPLGAQNCERIRKTRVSRFLPFYLLILVFQASSCIPGGRARRDLLIDIKDYWFHVMWLGIRPFLWFIVESSMEIYGNLCLAMSGYATYGHRWPYMAILLYMHMLASESGRPGFHVFCFSTPLFWCSRFPRVSHGEDLDEIYRSTWKILDFMACGSVFSRFCNLS